MRKKQLPLLQRSEGGLLPDKLGTRLGKSCHSGVQYPFEFHCSERQSHQCFCLAWADMCSYNRGAIEAADMKRNSGSGWRMSCRLSRCATALTRPPSRCCGTGLGIFGAYSETPRGPCWPAAISLRGCCCAIRERGIASRRHGNPGSLPIRDTTAAMAHFRKARGRNQGKKIPPEKVFSPSNPNTGRQRRG